VNGLEGQLIGEFKILTQIGQGGMGTVYLAEQPALNRRVAVKVLAPELVHDGDFAKRFKREAMVAASVNHPGMVQVYAAGESEGIHYIAMEYVDGESLQRRMDREVRIKLDDALAIIISLAQALDTAWQKAWLIHRDVKPSNVLLSTDGAIKLADFGMARNANVESTLTSTGMPIGTPLYASPEQARSHKNLNFSTDIYSLGCTLYHMLCGRAPYVGDGSFAIMLLHVTEPVPSILKHLPGCPQPIVKLLDRMLAKEPERRHASYAELIEELRAAREAPAAPPKKLPRVTIMAIAVAGLAMAAWFGVKKFERRPVIPAVIPASTATADPPMPAPRIDGDFLQAVAALPPEAQATRVIEKLKELNPAFDPATATYTIENGVVVTFSTSITAIRDISPVRALVSLRDLRLGQTGQVSKLLADLRPLQGLALTRFDCHNSQVGDLTPLSGMPLTFLVCSGSRIKDLSPVKNCPLQILAINDTGVSSLEPIKGMAITTLNCGLTNVDDLLPLKGMPLKEFNCAHTGVRDLTPIAAALLYRLVCHHTAVDDLSPLSGMPLREIDCDFDPARDAQVLRGITTLEKINNQPADEFWRNN
jgi:predicted Ser/Thr protein kinase